MSIQPSCRLVFFLVWVRPLDSTKMGVVPSLVAVCRRSPHRHLQSCLNCPPVELSCKRCSSQLDLDVETLKVKGTFPNVDADDMDAGQERILVGRHHNLERLALGIVALHRSRNKDENEGS